MGLKDERFVNVRAFPLLLLPFASPTLSSVPSTFRPLCVFVLYTNVYSAASVSDQRRAHALSVGSSAPCAHRLQREDAFGAKIPIVYCIILDVMRRLYVDPVICT